LPNSLELANTYHNLGVILHNQKQWDESVRYDTYFNLLGLVLYNLKQWDELVRYYKMALSIYEQKGT
jgi:tetratricopeptide (TPR) repeat protein